MLFLSYRAVFNTLKKCEKFKVLNNKKFLFMCRCIGTNNLHKCYEYYSGFVQSCTFCQRKLLETKELCSFIYRLE